MSAQQNPISLRDFLTISEAAQVLGVSSGTLRQWDRIGKLKSVRHPINSYRLYRRCDLESLLIQLISAAPATELEQP